MSQPCNLKGEGAKFRTVSGTCGQERSAFEGPQLSTVNSSAGPLLDQ